MQVQIENIDTVTKRITVTLPADRVKTALDDVYRQLAKSATVKGFRKGKAPREVLERIYKPRVEADVIQHLVEESYPKAVEEQKLMPVAGPVIRETRLEPGKDFVYTATVEVKPDFELPPYKGFKFAVPVKAVEEKDLEEQLTLLRERKATLIPVLEDRALASGDVAVVDIESFIGGSPVATAREEGATFELGKGLLLDEFESGLPGARVGETRAIEVAYPEDHVDPKTAGKKVLYRLALKEIKRMELPAADDEFAKAAGAEGLTDLKSKIKTELTAHHAEERAREIHKQLFDRILEKLTVDVPPALLDHELKRLYASAKKVLGERAIDRKSFEMLQSNLKDQAVRRVKERLVLDEVIRREGLAPTQADLDAHFAKVGQRYGQNPAAVKAYYMQEGRVNALVSLIAEEKALDFLEKQSTITE